MKMDNKKLIASIILTIVLTIGVWQNALAWETVGNWSTNYAYYRFDSTVPTAFRSHITFGANVWTNVDVSSWTWYSSTTQGVKIYYNNIDGPDGTIGLTTSIYNLFGYLSNSSYVQFDSSENWYAGTGIPLQPPYGAQYDLRSTAAHEMGHALGLAHTSAIYCPGNTNDATMCSGTGWGYYFKRTLEGDDRNGVKALYP